MQHTQFLLPDQQGESGEKGIGRLMMMVVLRLLEEVSPPQKMLCDAHSAPVGLAASHLAGCESRILHSAKLRQFRGRPLLQIHLGSSRLT